MASAFQAFPEREPMLGCASMTATNLDAPAAVASPQQRSGKHIIDLLIEERAPKLSSHPSWSVLRPALYTILNYNKAVYMADMIAPMGGRQALEWLAELLSLDVQTHNRDRMPSQGAFILLANHPTGITDGIAMFEAIKRVRGDTMFYANSDAQRVCERFDDILIPVEWVLAKRTRERTRLTLKMTEQAFAEQRPLMIFPAGRLSRLREGVLTDPEWMPSAASLARKYNLPVLPCHASGPYAFWFHTFAKISPELRDMTLFHELLNKQGKTYRLTFGPLIPPAHVAGDPTHVIRQLKHYIERVLPESPDQPFDPEGPECQWRDPPQAPRLG
jgi:putative hemolysin